MLARAPTTGIAMVDGQPDGLTYAEWAAHPALAEYVVCSWANPAPRRSHLVLPHACVDIVWDGARLLVAGPDTDPAEIAPGLDFVGIRFRPAVAPAFVRVSASELRGLRVPLAEFWGPDSDELADRLLDTPTDRPKGTAELLERALLPAAAPN